MSRWKEEKYGEKQVVEEKKMHLRQILRYVQKDCNIPQLFLLLDFYFIDVNNTIFNVHPGHTGIRFLAMCFFSRAIRNTIIHDEINSKYLSIS